jgi:hypothetical protein
VRTAQQCPDGSEIDSRKLDPTPWGVESYVTILAESHDFSVERVHPTLEDAFLGLAQPEIAAMTL